MQEIVASTGRKLIVGRKLVGFTKDVIDNKRMVSGLMKEPRPSEGLRPSNDVIIDLTEKDPQHRGSRRLQVSENFVLV